MKKNLFENIFFVVFVTTVHYALITSVSLKYIKQLEKNMQVVSTISEVRAIINKVKKEDKKVGFVPTMGFLHEGHLSLVELSRQYADFHVMSIFVNKIQFNDINDFNSYPKDLEKDIELAAAAGIDLIFMPNDEEMYNNNLTSVDVDLLTENLCGAHRPGHFKGVFTVVSKLFNIVDPDVAVFGQKDIQQATSLEKMVKDLNFPIKMIIGAIKRENDGLAMSSRNKHLDATQRKNSLVLHKSLQAAENMIKTGETEAAKIKKAMQEIIKTGDPTSIDYISIVSYEDLSTTEKIAGKSVIALAVFFGSTRLIDNMIIDLNNEINCIY